MNQNLSVNILTLFVYIILLWCTRGHYIKPRNQGSIIYESKNCVWLRKAKDI